MEEREAPTQRQWRAGGPVAPSAAAADRVHGHVAGPATSLRTVLGAADAGSRNRVVGALQRSHGNAAVQRLVSGAPLPVQRWRVGLPRDTSDCGRVVDHLNATSPHRATSGWAKTRVRFNWGGDPAFDDSGGSLSATVANPTVRKRVSVDMPEWSPTNQSMATAWSGMSATLRAHEAEHEGIADTWETTLRSDLSSLTVWPASRTLSAFNTAVQSEWDGWLGQHQADQDAIDPFTAMLDCSGPEPEASAGEAAEPGEPGEVEEAG